jgi:hypothetical protein
VPKFEDAIFAYLSTEPQVSDLVETRIYPGKLPEPTTFPAIVWHRISARRTRTYDKFESFDAFATIRVQFDCWAEEPGGYDTAVEVGEALLGALSGYGGMMSGTLITAHPLNEFDDHDSDTKLFRRSLDFEVTYEDDVRTPGVDGLATPAAVEGSGST